MTLRLYYDDAYTLNFDAQVVERLDYRQRPALVLDRTYFYPEGGGQPADQGVLNGVRVIDVQSRDSDRAVLHILERQLPDAQVEGHIDSQRRFDLMQHHSGQHILSQALIQAASAETISVHMSPDSMTIDVNRTGIGADEWATVEALANGVVQENRTIRCWYPSADELAGISLRKTPEVAGKLRIVDVGGFDVTACGGTHVARSGEIGLIKVIRAERRGDTTRLEFRCGKRALADYSAKNDVINRLTAEASVGQPDLVDAFRRITSENKTLRAALKIAREQLAESEAQQIVAATALNNGRRVVTRVFTDRSAEDARLLLQKLCAQAGVVVLFGVAGDTAQLMFGRADDVALDVVPLLKQALAALNCDRGGGRPNLAQGGGISATPEQITAAIGTVLPSL